MVMEGLGAVEAQRLCLLKRGCDRCGIGRTIEAFVTRDKVGWVMKHDSDVLSSSAR